MESYLFRWMWLALTLLGVACGAPPSDSGREPAPSAPEREEALVTDESGFTGSETSGSGAPGSGVTKSDGAPRGRTEPAPELSDVIGSERLPPSRPGGKGSPDPAPEPEPSRSITPLEPPVAPAEESVDVPLPGQVVFNPPARMRVGRAERVEVRVVQNITSDLTQGLRGSGTPVVERHKVSRVMRVSLTGDHFEIVAMSELEQLVDAQDFTEWSFSVTPQKHGEQRLYLAVTMVLDLPGRGEKARTLPVIDRPIDVEVDALFAIQTFAREHWEFLASSLILPLIAFGYTVWQRKRKAQGGGAQQDAEAEEEE